MSDSSSDLGSSVFAYARRAQTLRPSAVREILKVTAQPDVISFAGGLPATELFPVEAMRAAADSVLSKDGRAALQYGVTEGHPALIVHLLPISGAAHDIFAAAKTLLLVTDVTAPEAPTQELLAGKHADLRKGIV